MGWRRRAFLHRFKPEIASGYADYVMQPNVTYTVRIAESERLFPIGRALPAPIQADRNIRAAFILHSSNLKRKCHNFHCGIFYR